MPILLILFVAALIELTVLVAVGQTIGVLPTLGLLVLASLLGVVLLRREGMRTLHAFNEAVRTRRPPHRELLDGVLIAAAGVLVVVPGFVSDVLGLLLLLPPTRALVRGRILGRFPAPVARPAHGPVVDGTVVDGTVVDDSGVNGSSGHGPAGRRPYVEGEVLEGEIVDGPPNHPRRPR